MRALFPLYTYFFFNFCAETDTCIVAFCLRHMQMIPVLASSSSKEGKELPE